MQAALRPDLCQRAAAARAVDRRPEALGDAAQQEDPEERLQGQQLQLGRRRQDIAKVRNAFFAVHETRFGCHMLPYEPPHANVLFLAPCL